MMENDGGSGEVQGSGWFEVKKRHRTSSKLSMQKVSGVSFNKSQSYSPYCQALVNDEVGNLQSGQKVQPAERGVEFVAHTKVSGVGSPSVVADDGKPCHDKVVVNQENGSCMLRSLEVANSEGQAKATQEVPIKETLGDIPKIKWGDLEDSALMPSGCCDDSVRSIKTESGNAAGSNLQEHGKDVECDSSYAPLQEGEVTSKDVEQFPDGMLCSVGHEKYLEGTYKEMGEIFSMDLELVTTNQERILNGGAKTTQNVASRELGSNEAVTENFPSSPVEGIIEMAVEECYNNTVDGACTVSEEPIINEQVDTSIDLQDSILLPHQNNGAEISIDDSVTAAIEDGRGLQDDTTVGTHLKEGEQGESKERFRQRLWCFLFENLNRAVDELYLLCELECDKEQMNEAILVLEEAASDFNELKSRVEHFENTKRPTSQSPKDGKAMNAKTDHRRPHALSWEVRRMTTSPHRAEILSSSLEVFKKIQLERARNHVIHDAKDTNFSYSSQHYSRSSSRANELPPNTRETNTNSEKQTGILDANTKGDKLNVETSRQIRTNSVQNGRIHMQSLSAAAAAKCKREPLEPISETGKQVSRKDKVSAESKVDKQSKVVDIVKKHNSLVDKEKEKEKEKRSTAPWKPLDAWKEKRNWEDILKSPMRNSRVSHSPGLRRKGMEHARVLHDKLLSPEKKKKSALDLKREAEEKHARAMRIRSQLENERVQKLQRTSEKLNRVNEWQAVRSLKLREGMHARHQRSESRHEAYLAQVARRAGDESSKVNEVRFITSLNEENKKLMLRQKLHDSEMRRAEKLQVIKSKQKEDVAREEAVLERRRLLEAEKLQRLAETQRKKEEAQVRREEERRASSAAREAKAVEQLRRKEVRAKAQQEEAELLAQKLAERLSESEQRRKFYLEQIREKASMDFRDQSSPLLRRSLNKEGQHRSMSTNSIEDYQTSCISNSGHSSVGLVNATQQQSLKRRIKKIRQRLMALKYEFIEPPLGADNSGIGYRSLVGTARAKIGRWLQDLQRLRQARKEGAASIGLVVGDMVKFLDGKEPELHASRQAGLLDFISSALPASHTSKPEACQVTIYLLRLLRVVLSVPANRSYFLAQNLLPPIIPMLSASLENYIKIAASFSPGISNILSSKTSTENIESIAEVLDGFLWTVTTIIGHAHTDERQLQMQDSLMELIVAYRIIHRLRDLFALYDRPQVEGSPFPSSILLSLNLLAVLTSKCGTISSIDWETCISKAAAGSKDQEPQNLESEVIGDSSLINNPSGHVIAELPPNESGQMLREGKLQPSRISLSHIPESRPSDGEIQNNYDISDRLDNAEVKCAESASGDIQNIVLLEEEKPLSSQKEEKNAINGYIGGKRIDEHTMHGSIGSRKEGSLKQPVVFLLSAITETGLVGLPSLLTAVLLQANNKLSSEQAAYILPSNFEEVATGVLKVLNNLAILDISLLQSMLATPDLKMEFFHLMSFLLSHCTSKWKAASDKVGLLLLESLLLLGYFALFHPGNQAVLRWGKSPTILHKVCDLPFVFFSDPELTPILAGTLVAACYGCDQNRGVVQQELSTDMLLSVLKSCRQGLIACQSDCSPPDTSVASDPCDGIQPVSEGKKPQGDIPLRINRRSTRVVLGKGGISGSSIRVSKAKILKDTRGTKTCDEWALKHNLPASETSSSFMLHKRFPTNFLDKAQEFFAAGSSDL